MTRMTRTKTDPTRRALTAQFYHGNHMLFLLSVAASLCAGSLNLLISWLLQQTIDTASGVQNSLPLSFLAVLCAGLVGLCILFSLFDALVRPRFLERAMRQYKDFAFRKLTEKSISSFRAENTATYLSALTNDAASIETSYLAEQLAMATKIVTCIGALWLMLRYSVLLTGIAAAVTALPLAASLLCGNGLAKSESRVSEENRDFTAALHDCLAGFSVVKSFRAEREIFAMFAARNRSLEKEKRLRAYRKSMIAMAGAVTGVFAQLAVFLVGAWLALSGSGLTAGAVILFVNLMNFTIDPIAALPGFLASRKASRGLIAKLADALEKNPDAAGETVLPQLTEGITLDDVSFGYTADTEVLRHITAKFAAGKSYAIVGASGSGKSTLLNLLLSSGAPYRGSIRFDGVELRDIAPASLYEQIGSIQQNVFVFNASIRDNITMFRDFPEDKVADAVSHARLAELVAARGMEYACGEGGCGLSGGEKQRISIARSLLKNAAVLLVDEATSALDPQTAHRVSADILALTGITRIVVTHTLEESLLRRYDGIYVLKNGTIAESGTFDALMAEKGYFYALYTVAQ